jgi:hypothetical protein
VSGQLHDTVALRRRKLGEMDLDKNVFKFLFNTQRGMLIGQLIRYWQKGNTTM